MTSACFGHQACSGYAQAWGSAATSAGPSSGVQTHASLPGLSDFGLQLGGGGSAGVGGGGARVELGAALYARRGVRSGLGSVLGSDLGSGAASASAGDNCLRALGGLVGAGGGGGAGMGGGASCGWGAGEQRGAPSPMALPPGAHFVLGGGGGELGSPGMLLSQDLQARAVAAHVNWDSVVHPYFHEAQLASTPTPVVGLLVADCAGRRRRAHPVRAAAQQGRGGWNNIACVTFSCTGLYVQVSAPLYQPFYQPLVLPLAAWYGDQQQRLFTSKAGVSSCAVGGAPVATSTSSVVTEQALP